MIRERIEEKLRAAFQPVFLEVVMKAIVTMSQPALKAILKLCWSAIVLRVNVFLNRHRMIYSTLAEELSTTVHALALHTYTIKEWEGLQDTVFASPPCRGAGSIA